MEPGLPYCPRRVTLNQFDPNRATERLVDCWRALQRSSVDAATLPSNESNIFAFAEACIYLATVHDADFVRNKMMRLERDARERLGTATLPPRRDRSSPSGNEVTGPEVNTSTGSQHSERILGGLGQSLGTNAIHSREALLHRDRITRFDRRSPTYMSGGHAQGHPTNNDFEDLDGDSEIISDCDEPPITNPCNNPEAGSTDLVGIAYLYPATGSASTAGEVSLGVALLPHARGKGFGTETVRHLLVLAFEEFKCHRVSAGVIGPSLRHPSARVTSTLSLGTLAETEAALRMFVALGFAFEGMRRRAVPDLEDHGAWRDAHYLAMLDTEWVTAYSTQQWLTARSDDVNAHEHAPAQSRRTRWDEMLARHQSETEALIGAEFRLKKSSSMETLRASAGVKLACVDIVTPSTFTTSASQSECSSNSGAEPELSQGFRFSSARSVVKSPSTSSLNPFRDPSTTSLWGLLSRSRPRFTLRTGSESESESQIGDGKSDDPNGGDRSINLDGAMDVLEKVANYLLAYPTPGPPPSEAGSNLDSEAESASDFESCADLDKMESLRGTKEKGEAEEVKGYGLVQTASLTGQSSPITSSDVTKDPSASSPASGPQETDEHTRKKPRLMSNLEKGISTGNTGILTAPGVPTFAFNPPHPTVSPFSFNANVSGLTFNPLRPVFNSAALGAEVELSLVREGRPDSEARSVVESEMSDAETASTTMSTWDVVSGGASMRSPSPSLSVSSGAGSLRLQSASESED